MTRKFRNALLALVVENPYGRKSAGGGISTRSPIRMVMVRLFSRTRTLLAFESHRAREQIAQNERPTPMRRFNAVPRASDSHDQGVRPRVAFPFLFARSNEGTVWALMQVGR